MSRVVPRCNGGGAIVSGKRLERRPAIDAVAARESDPVLVVGTGNRGRRGAEVPDGMRVGDLVFAVGEHNHRIWICAVVGQRRC